MSADTSRFLEDDAIGYDALWEAMEKCLRGVRWKGSAASFYLHAPEQILKLSKQLKTGTYVARQPIRFHISHPKPRDIAGVCFRDRIVQRSYIDNVLYPCMHPTWIYDNYACQTGKGTDFGRSRVKEYLRKQFFTHGFNSWILKCDIRKYYDSLLYRVIGENFYKHCPEWAAYFAENIITTLYGNGLKHKGVNPGSPLVQLAGIEYLSRMDHFIKEVYRIKCYGRYMDDFVIMHHDRKLLEELKCAISDITNEVGLSLHPNKTRLFPLSEPFIFLGFKYTLTDTGKIVLRVLPNSVTSTKRKLKRLYSLETSNRRPKGTCDASYDGWRAHAEKGDNYILLSDMDDWYMELKDSFYEHENCF